MAAKRTTNPGHGSSVVAESNPASNPAHGSRPRPPSLCAPLVTEIEAALTAGLSAQRIYQDLIRDHGFRGGCSSVKQFVRRLTSTLELRGTPRNKIQMFSRYQLKKTKDGGFAVKAGVVSQTSVYGRASNTYSLPGATRYDIGLDYRNDRWSFAAGLVNLTDVIFPTFAVGQGSNTIDDPRNFYFSVGRKF